MNRTESFVEALLMSPLGVVLLGFLESGTDPDGGWVGRSAPTSTAATVAATVDAVATM